MKYAAFVVSMGLMAGGLMFISQASPTVATGVLVCFLGYAVSISLAVLRW